MNQTSTIACLQSISACLADVAIALNISDLAIPRDGTVAVGATDLAIASDHTITIGASDLSILRDSTIAIGSTYLAISRELTSDIFGRSLFKILRVDEGHFFFSCNKI